MRSLLRTREVKILLAAYAATAIVCAFLPLADHVGFEFALLLTLVSAVVAPFVGFAAMRIDRQAGTDGRRPARAAAQAGLVAVISLLLPTALILLNGLRRPICDPVAGSVWLVLLPAPTAWLSAALGALARLLFDRTRWAVLVVAAVELATIVTSLAVAYVGPASFVLDHFAGYFPGSARSGAIDVTPAVVSFRAATVLWGAAAIAMAGAIGTGDRAARRMHRSWAVALSLGLVAASIGWGSALGWRVTDRSLRHALGGLIRTDHLVIHFPRELSDRSIELLVRDATYDAARIAQSLGITPAKPVHVWVYSSLAQKRRLVGGGNADFAKPNRHEVHVLQSRYPHGSLRHELIHAMAAEFARGPWLTPGGLIPNVALVEGFAMAYDVDDESLTLFQEAKAMRDLKLAPSIERLLAPGGFSREAPTRAYKYTGAFVRYLDSRFGTAAMRRLYLTGKLSELGDQTAIISGFDRMLDTVQSDANARSTAARRHAQPSILRQRCPREISVVMDSAFALAANRMWVEALAMIDRACALQPENPDHLASKLTVAIRARPDAMAPILAIADSLWRHPRIDAALEANARVQVGDELWRRGETTAAREAYQRAAALPADPTTRRSTVIRLRTLDDTARASVLKPLFVDTGEGFTQVLRMSDALPRRPTDALLLYLLARQYQQRGGADKSAELMERADAAGLGDADLTRENLRTLVVARAERNRCDEAGSAVERLRAANGSRADIATSEDWVLRCRFAVARGWKPL